MAAGSIHYPIRGCRSMTFLATVHHLVGVLTQRRQRLLLSQSLSSCLFGRNLLLRRLEVVSPLDGEGLHLVLGTSFLSCTYAGWLVICVSGFEPGTETLS